MAELVAAINAGLIVVFSKLRCFSLELALAKSLGCVARPRSGSPIQRAIYEMAAPTGRTAFFSNPSGGTQTVLLAVYHPLSIRFPNGAALFGLGGEPGPVGSSGSAFVSLFKAVYERTSGSAAGGADHGSRPARCARDS